MGKAYQTTRSLILATLAEWPAGLGFADLAILTRVRPAEVNTHLKQLQTVGLVGVENLEGNGFRAYLAPAPVQKKGTA